ncbi:unnamed protein product [marine sediment metagenome]|uniref:Uncharacterized protein n=1 Tax=marine sediment metagenome TaxID=412755 RepID=X0ZNY0_9ZZZZ
MKKITLKASKRKILGKKTKSLRKAGLVPAILYGHKIKNAPLAIDKKEFDRVYKKAGQTTLIDLRVQDEKPQKVLIHETQLDPISDNIVHIDFRQVAMTEKIKTEVPVETGGEAPAVTELDGSLILNKDTIEIECLPQDLIHEIKVDISGLKTFENRILVKDLKVPENIVILDNPEEVVVLVTPPRTEEELAELEEVVEEKPEEIEVEAEKEEKEEEEGAKETEKKEVVEEKKPAKEGEKPTPKEGEKPKGEKSPAEGK